MVQLLSETMKMLRRLLVASLTLSCVSLVASTGCAERPGKKKDDKDDKKGDKGDKKGDEGEKKGDEGEKKKGN